ncbi:MAG TPA: endonuclease/exonuclease/phosphatase family protein [Candidatus Eisenbacteria bacterium]|jgi:endonuclease/exonuclease/phosphatase family metal-dependent hydrolase
MSSPIAVHTSDPARVAEAHALRRALEPFSTLRALHADPGWPALAARLATLLDGVRMHAPPSPRASTSEPGRVRVAHWNIEHGNRFEAIARAFTSQEALATADLVTLNEVDLGMARSGNRDVAADLCARLGMHAAWAAMFLESTRGRDDDSLTALAADNAESLFGLALLSRWPIAAARLVTLPGPERTLFERERMTGRFVALVCDIAHPLHPFTAATVHLEVHRTRAHRATQMRLLLEALAGERKPVLLSGDWNTHTFDRGERRAALTAAGPLLTWPREALAARLTHPDRGPHREGVFDELRAAGFRWEPYADFAPTLSVRFSRLGEVHALPGPLRALASRGLRWAERRAQLRLDWISARGFRHGAGRGCTIQGLGGLVHEALDEATYASDHAPIVAELAFE